jgi:hypothetical protein
MLAGLGWPLRDEPFARRPVERGRIRATTEDQLAVCRSAGVRPERPYLMTQITVASDLHEGGWPLYGVRMRPSQRHRQSGWFIWSRDPDFSHHTWEFVEAGAIGRRRAEAERFLALPPGWAFVLGPEGYEDVWFDADNLEGAGDPAAGS